MDDVQYDPSVIADMEHMLNSAGAIIDGYRHILGNFAVDRDTVVAEYVIEFSTFNGLRADGIMYYETFIDDDDDAVAYEHARNVYMAIRSRLAGNSITSVEWNYASAEAWLWDCVINDISFDSVDRRVRGHLSAKYFNLLQKVYENPSHLPFYEAGIWDEDVIARCIADGMDAEIARSLSK